jgi:predicted phage baseplate assembly protein
VNGCTGCGLDTCGCCSAGVDEAPQISNRAGLPALSYRVGTYGSFLRRMLARLPRNEDGLSLARLTTRAPDDPALALLDAFAVTADVVTFYEERIANEGFLRTATDRRSILELAREIGYELDPGVAAGTYLRFEVEDRRTPDQPDPVPVTVPQGTKVLSLPAQGKLPQPFETSADLEARADWNALSPRLLRPQGVDDTLLAASVVYLSGTTTGLQTGDLLLIVTDLDVSKVRLVPVVRVVPEAELSRTRVELSTDASVPPYEPQSASDAYLQEILGLLGFSQTEIDELVDAHRLSATDLWVDLIMTGWDIGALIAYLRSIEALPAPAVTDLRTGVFAFRDQTGFFGASAPRFASLPPKDKSGSDYGTSWDSGWQIWTDQPSNSYYTNADVYLDRVVQGIAPESWVVIESPNPSLSGPILYGVAGASDEGVAGFGTSARATGLRLTDVTGTRIGDSDKQSGAELVVREATAHVRSEELPLADLPIEEPIASPTSGPTDIELDRTVAELQAGRLLAITGERTDRPGVLATEVVAIDSIVQVLPTTIVRLAAPLQLSYKRDTVSIAANVVPATHGETVPEVLGSGDSGTANQRFTLKKPPLTYVSAASGTGSKSTLEVRVDGIAWTEAPSLYGLGPRDERYIVRRADDGSTVITFGDGISGARVPTGAENVAATYRSGIGSDGLVDAGRLTLLQTRPVGVRGVTNPNAATGAADPESRDDARANAPLTVLTMDRIVSLLDYEDFARGFAGIGKAQAVALWKGELHLVHVTIAGAGGATVPTDSETYANLVDAIAAAQDPGRTVLVASFDLLYFDLAATVKVDARYRFADVQAAAQAVLLDTYSFPRRDFAQPVTPAEVTTLIQGVAGVVYVDLDSLNVTGQAPPTGGVLTARRADWHDEDKTSVDPAQLLLVNPTGVTLTEATT